jgi:hypothetical protein
MSNRVELKDFETESVNGGILHWEGGQVYPKDNPSAVYNYTDYDSCLQWIVANWSGAQKENCLMALEAAGNHK